MTSSAKCTGGGVDLSRYVYQCHRGPDAAIVSAPPEDWCRLLDDALCVNVNSQALHTLGHISYVYLWDKNPAPDAIAAWGRKFLEPSIVKLLDYLGDIKAIVAGASADSRSITPFRHWITDIVILLSLFLKMVCAPPNHPHHKRGLHRTYPPGGVEDFLRPLYPKMHRLFKALWDIRETTFITERGVQQHDLCSNWFTVHGAINSFMEAVAVPKYFPAMPATTRLDGARVNLVVWLYASTASDTSHASDLLWSYLHHGKSPNHDTRDTDAAFCKYAVYGNTGPRQVRNAMLRDLKHTRGQKLIMLVERAVNLRPSSQIDIGFRPEHTLLMCCVAACYREVCSPEESQPYGDHAIARVSQYAVYAFLKPTMDQAGMNHIPERTIYALLPIMGQGCASALPDERSSISAFRCMRKAFDNCAILLRMHCRDPGIDARAGHKPPSAHTRRFTEKAWQDSREAMVADGWRINPNKKRAYESWLAIGRELKDSAVDDSVDSPSIEYEVSKRCAWKECMCSIYKPLHSLKMCTGCSMAVYCSTHCQKADWKAHRKVCIKMTG